MNTRTLQVVIGLALVLARAALWQTADAQEQPETSGYLVESSSAIWLALLVPDGDWAVQLEDGCPISPDTNVTVVGAPDEPDAQVRTADGTSCQLVAVEFQGGRGCVLNPRVGICDVHYAGAL